ncbi:prephenate dehydrogenase [Caldalkalibacillus salinus]|uniref:prephenate dehydrogenase n=1 Tax=Caldalkalibacillus salinus TaxID=2803787 RepID=UPI001922864B|nr:prephenate dehydrogenase [Caldalkalibacillus salinus]
MKQKQVTVIGTGLIGGSLALALKKEYGDELYIKGYDHHHSQIRLASTLGVVDEGTTSVQESIAGADIIVICTPVQVLCELLEEIMTSPLLKEGAIITDVGSTKTEVVQRSEKYTSQTRGHFIGGHPMAGSHKSGVEAAHDRLFENAYYVLTPSEDSPQAKVDELRALLTATKAKLVQMSPQEHDEVVAAISHFPHVIASALVEHVQQYNTHNPWYFRLAAGGFKDITRIASSNPRMWRDITISNREPILRQMKDWQHYMDELINMLEQNDVADIESFYAHAKTVRDGLPERKRGAIPAFYDLYVDIPDHPGVIGEITTLLGEEDISITNLEILETREDIMGVLRLAFRHEKDLQAAKQVIQRARYAVYERD